MNGALDEAMKIIKGSLADNSQVEQPYHTKGKIFLNENGLIVSIYIKGIIVDFETITSIDMDTESEYYYRNDKLIEMGWKKVTNKDELEDWIMTSKLSSLEWDGKERNYFDF